MSYGLPERQQDLSAENVEVVCRSRAVHNNPVTVIKLMHGKVFRQFLPTYNEVKKQTEITIQHTKFYVED